MNTNQVNRVVSWSTTKTEAGYEFKVYSFDHETPVVVHAFGTMRTRAQAASRAKAWTRYIKAKQ